MTRPPVPRPEDPLQVREEEVVFTAVRAQGPGGQNVNKLSTAVQLRFDIRASSLPPEVKQALLAAADRRLSREGVLVIKAQAARTQARNRAQALARLQALVDAAAVQVPERRPTRPTYGSTQRRLRAKAVRARLKAGRRAGDE